MTVPPVNYLAVFVAAVAIFALGGLWYSPALFGKQWVALTGRATGDPAGTSLRPTPARYVQVFICGLLSAWALAVLLNHFVQPTALRAALLGGLCWVGFTGATSYAGTLFGGKAKGLWLIDSTYNLVSFIVAGVILALWR
ncbi:MAG: hypothetical protein PVSMB1_02590 [Gemmatimonadaceae bacterium]